MKNYIRGIDGLRAIAVVAVIVFHAFPTALPGGFIGVDVFFVISGFIITKTYFRDLEEKRLSIGQFFTKRVRRLAPIYIVVLLVTTAASYFILIPIHLRHFAESLVAQPIYLQNLVFWHHGDYFEQALSKPLLHTWSLAVEEQFYLSYAVLILVVRRAPKLAIPLTASAAAVSLVLGFKLYSISPKTVFYWLPPRMWELALGMLAALVVARASRKIWPYLEYVGLALIVFAIVRFDERAALPGVQSLAACFGTALALMSVSTGGTGEAGGPALRVLANPVMVWLGKLSYSLYLWHWPIIALAATYLERPLRPLEGAVAVALTIALSHFGLEYIEKPVREKRLFARDGKLLGAALVGGIVTAAIAIVFVKTDGAMFRYPADIATLYFAQENRSPYRCPSLGRLADPSSEVCKINTVTSGPANVLVLGDSHADVLDEVIAEVAGAEGRSAFLTKRDCKLYDFGATPQCSADVLTQIEKDIAENKIKYVLSMAFMKADFKDEDAKALEASAVKLLESVDRVFIMQVVPHDAFFDPGNRAHALSKKEPLPRPYTSADYAQDNRVPIEALRKIATANPRITILDPSRYLCAESACDFDTNGIPNYFDAHHLSPVGAKRLGPMFTSALRSVTSSKE